MPREPHLECLECLESLEVRFADPPEARRRLHGLQRRLHAQLPRRRCEREQKQRISRGGAGSGAGWVGGWVGGWATALFVLAAKVFSRLMVFRKAIDSDETWNPKQ